MTIATRQSSCFRPLFVDGKEISAIIIYNESGTLYSTHQGWLELDKKDSIALHLPTVRIARTINLDKKDCFIIKNKLTYKQQTNYILYIYADGKNISVSIPEEVVALQTNRETNYKLKYSITIPHQVDLPRLNDREQVEYSLSEIITAPVSIFSPYYSKSVPTPFGEQINQTLAQFEALNIHISSYDIEKILEKFDITPKQYPDYSLRKKQWHASAIVFSYPQKNKNNPLTL